MCSRQDCLQGLDFSPLHLLPAATSSASSAATAASFCLRQQDKYLDEWLIYFFIFFGVITLQLHRQTGKERLRQAFGFAGLVAPGIETIWKHAVIWGLTLNLL